jgi:hypothetical protein
MVLGEAIIQIATIMKENIEEPYSKTTNYHLFLETQTDKDTEIKIANLIHNRSLYAFVVSELKWTEGDDKELTETGQKLPQSWIRTIPSRILDFVTSLNVICDEQRLPYSTVIDVAYKRLCIDLTDYNDKICRIGWKQIIPSDPRGIFTQDTLFISNLLESLKAGNGCVSSFDNCLQEYKIDGAEEGALTEVINNEQPVHNEQPEQNEQTVQNEHLYFSVQWPKSYGGNKSYLPIRMCAAHLILYATKEKALSTSLYGTIDTMSGEIPMFITTKGTATYVSNVAGTNTKPNTDLINAESPSTNNVEIPVTGDPRRADINGIFFDGPRHSGENLTPHGVNGNVRDILPGTVPTFGAVGGAAGGAAVAGAVGGTPGASGASGASAIAIAVLGAVTVAASLCRR